MKTKKNIFVFVIIMIAFGVAFPEVENVYPGILTIIRYVEDGIPGYNTGGNYQIGRLDESGVDIRYRTRYEFHFSAIPQDARINSVKISYHINNGASSSYTAKFVKLPDEYYGESDQWGKFTSSQTIYASGLSYNSSYWDKIYAQLTADVTTAIHGDDRLLCIGFMGENEGTNQTHANVVVDHITVDYSPKVTVTVQNIFDGGKVAVDGLLKDSPWTFTDWYAGDSHNIRAYTQDIGAVTHRFPEPGMWINLTTSQVKYQEDNNTPVTINPDDDCTWQANFNPGTVHLTVDQKLSSGISTGSVGFWEGGPDFEGYTVPESFDLPVSSNQVFRAEQNIMSGEKYNHWIKGSNNLGDVTNHHVFQIDNNFPGDLTAQFNLTFEGISIQVDFEGTSENYDCPIQFKDPWFTDYSDPSYGNNYRNRANNALFKTRTVPFVIDYSTSYESGQSYKGVFLNQNPTFDVTKPIYSLKAPNIGQITQSAIYAFDHWQGTNVDFGGGANNNETDVVFKSANATVTAVYTPVNQIANYTLSLSSGDNLTFPAGAQIACAENFCIELSEGEVHITGNEDNPVVLYSNSQWQGILSVDSYLSADIQHVILRNALYGIKIDAENSCENLQISVSHTLFKNIQKGIYLYIEDGYAPDFDNVDITLSYCSFVDNDKAIEILSDNNNQGVENDFNLQVVNNIFYNSDLQVDCFPGLHLDSKVKYNRFYNSNVDLCDDPNIYSMGNTYGNPLFVNPSSGNYHLQSTSPCINTGDPSFPDDPDNTNPDIGAYYFDLIPAAPYLISVAWVSSHPKLLWNKVADLDIETYRVYKTYVNSSGSRTTTVDVGSDTTYIDPEITYVNPRFANTTATYKVTAIDSVAQESAYSNSKTVKGNGPLWKPVV
ncbi:MAG: hypothetical protein V1715_06255, partial [bacterium]